MTCIDKRWPQTRDKHCVRRPWIKRQTGNHWDSNQVSNKSQGQTVRHVGLDLRRPVFTHGQFYVGISGVTSVWNIEAIWEQKERERQAEAKTKNVVYSEVLLR